MKTLSGVRHTKGFVSATVSMFSWTRNLLAQWLTFIFTQSRTSLQLKKCYTRHLLPSYIDSSPLLTESLRINSNSPVQPLSKFLTNINIHHRHQQRCYHLKPSPLSPPFWQRLPPAQSHFRIWGEQTIATWWSYRAAHSPQVAPAASVKESP